jgi:hypothetical protein
MNKLILLLLLTLSFGIKAQLSCGVSGDPNVDLTAFFQKLDKAGQQSRNARVSSSPNEINWVGLHIWVATKDGQLATTQQDILNHVTEANRQFLGANIQFFVRAIETISNDDYWELTTQEVENNLIAQDLTYNSTQGVNVYFLNSLGGFAGYCPFGNDKSSRLNEKQANAVYVLGKSVSNWYNILSHELGHYFGLDHTFQFRLDWSFDRVNDTPPDLTEYKIKQNTSSEEFYVTEFLQGNCNSGKLLIQKISDKSYRWADLKFRNNLTIIGNKQTFDIFTANRNWGSSEFEKLPTDNTMSYFKFRGADNRVRTCENQKFSSNQNFNIEIFTGQRISPNVDSYNILTPPISTTLVQNLQVNNIPNGGTELIWEISNEEENLGFIIEGSNTQSSGYKVIGFTLNGVNRFEVQKNNLSKFFRVRAANNNSYTNSGACVNDLSNFQRPQQKIKLTDKIWYNEFLQKANNFGFLDYQELAGKEQDFVDKGVAARTVFLLAKNLNITGFENLQTTCDLGDTEETFFNEFVNRGYFESSERYDDNISIGKVCDFIWKIIFNEGQRYGITQQRTDAAQVILETTPEYQSILALYQTIGYRASLENNGNYPSYLFDGNVVNQVRRVQGFEVVSNASFAKILTGAYEFVVNKSSVLTFTDAAGEELTDFILLGNKLESATNQTAAQPTLPIWGSTDYLISGESKSYEFGSPTHTDGSQLYFYWSINGRSDGMQLVAQSGYEATNQKVTITAPNVNSETFYTMLIQVYTSDGRFEEMRKKIVVRSASAPQSNSNLSIIEYYIDSDPGRGNGMQLNVSNNSVVDDLVSIDISNLSSGLHLLGLRVKGSANEWSQTITKSFFVLGNTFSAANLEHLEYFYDADDTQVQIAQVESNGTFSINKTFGNVGLYTITFRVKDSKGFYSHWKTMSYFKEPSIENSTSYLTDMEYYVDKIDSLFSPLFSTVLQIPNEEQFKLDLEISRYSVGNHILFVRVKNSEGMWSPFKSFVFNRPSNLCPENSMLQVNVSTNTEAHSASKQLTATNKILNEGSKTFYGAPGVTLEPGFEVKAGATFFAQPYGCEN